MKATPRFNRRFRRLSQSWLKGIFEFKRSYNSIYKEEHYREVFLKAITNSNRVMLNGASKSLNLHASHRSEPLYLRRQKATDGSRQKEEPIEHRHYPAGKTAIWHIKKEYQIINGMLQPTTTSNKRTNHLERRIGEIIRKANTRHTIKAENNVTGITIAFDYSDQDYWGQPNSEIIRTRAEGTTLAYRYGMARIVCAKAEYCLPPIKISSKSQIENDLEKTLHQATSFGISVNTMLLDRGFYTIDCMNLLRKRNVHFLMPAKLGALKRQMQKTIRRAPKEHVTIYRYSLGHQPRHSATAYIVVVPPRWQHPSLRNRAKHRSYSMVFATSIKLEPNATQTEIDQFGLQLSRIYRLRFGIETDWSILKTLRPRTTSPSAVLRLYYFYLSVLLYDMWVYARLIHLSLIRLDFFTYYIPSIESENIANSTPFPSDNG
jgi:hypothetical protein